jgi:hypothetical protein
METLGVAVGSNGSNGSRISNEPTETENSLSSLVLTCYKNP